MKIFVCLLLFFALACSLDNGEGITPPMGWNSWNHFKCNINETLIKKTADLLVSTGLAAKGYKYVNLDDCWQVSRNTTTQVIVQDPHTFPSGIPALGKYVHSKNLKIGLYSDAGLKTCQGRPGSYGFETIDANTYAKWQIDYLKYDNCYAPDVSAKLRYYAMKKALNQSGRHIFFSMCNWGKQDSATWAKDNANSWRTTGDISDLWPSFIKILQQQVGLEVYAGKGGWNDPDMLQVGNGLMTFNEQYTHLIKGCIKSSFINRMQFIKNVQQNFINFRKLRINFNKSRFSWNPSKKSKIYKIILTNLGRSSFREQICSHIFEQISFTSFHESIIKE